MIVESNRLEEGKENAAADNTYEEEREAVPMPPAWKDCPKEVDLAKKLFDKYKGATGKLGRQAFEQLVLSVVGTSAGAKSKRQQRQVAWYTNRDEQTDSTDFYVFLKILSLSGVSPKLLRMGYEGAMKPAEKAPSGLPCPQCGEELPISYINKDENEKISENQYILKRLEDIDRRRASLRDDAQKSGNGLVLENLDRIERSKFDTNSSSPRIDPKVSRLRNEEKNEVLQCLDTLVGYGFGEIADLNVLASSLRGEKEEREKEDEKEKATKRESLKETPDVIRPSPPPSPSKHDPSAPASPTQPRKRSVEAPPVHTRPVPPRALSVTAASPPRNLPRRSSVAPSPKTQRTNSNTPTYRRGSSSSTSGPSTPRGGTLRSSRSLDMTALVPTPPDPLPTPLELPEGLVKKETLNPSTLRRTVSLTECVKRGDLKMVKQWVESNGELNVFVDMKTTLVHLAVESRHKASCDIIRLVATGNNLKAWNEYGETALHTAARYGHHEKIAILIGCGADANVLDYRKTPALHVAVKAMYGAPCVSALAEAHADFNMLDPKGCTALFHAVTPDIVAALLKGGADPTKEDECGDTALHTLMSNGVFDDNEYHEALTAVATVRIMNHKNKAGDTPLHKLVTKGDCVLGERLAVLGADIDLENRQCETAMKILQRKWQQEAGSKSQLVWSGMLISWGMDIGKMSRKGTAWYQKNSFGWDAVPEDVQPDATHLHDLAKLEQNNTLISTDPDNLPPWALTVRKFLQPDKGEWNTTTVSLPPTLHPCQRVQLTLRSEQGEEVSSQLRVLPVV